MRSFSRKQSGVLVHGRRLAALVTRCTPLRLGCSRLPASDKNRRPRGQLELLELELPMPPREEELPEEIPLLPEVALREEETEPPDEAPL